MVFILEARLWLWLAVSLMEVLLQEENATVVNVTSGESNTTAPPREPFLWRFRKRIENGAVRYADDFKYEKLCDHGIAMYSKPKGYWRCTSDEDCPSFYSCSRSVNKTSYCCPSPTLCERGTPISDHTGIMTCKSGRDCPPLVHCNNNATDADSIGVCCAIEPCRNESIIPLISDLNPYPVLKRCVNTGDCGNGYTCLRVAFLLNTTCCRDEDANRIRGDTAAHLAYLMQLNEERIRRRKEKTRDLTYLIPLFGTPFLLVLAACAYQIKNEQDRFRRNQLVDEWIASRKKIARKMPSADLAKSKFKYKGVLKLHGEIGDVKHALDAESSRSLESIKLDPALNELVVIGSAVENIEDIEDVSEKSKPDLTGSKESVSKMNSAESVTSKSKEAITSKTSASKSQASLSQEPLSKSAEVVSAPEYTSPKSVDPVVARRPVPRPVEPKLSLPKPVSYFGRPPPIVRSVESSSKTYEEDDSVKRSVKSSERSRSPNGSSKQVDSAASKSSRIGRVSRSSKGRTPKLTSSKPSFFPIRTATSSPTGSWEKTTQRRTLPPINTGSRTLINAIFKSDSSEESDRHVSRTHGARPGFSGSRPKSRPSSLTPLGRTARSPSYPRRAEGATPPHPTDSRSTSRTTPSTRLPKARSSSSYYAWEQ